MSIAVVAIDDVGVAITAGDAAAAVSSILTVWGFFSRGWRA